MTIITRIIFARRTPDDYDGGADDDPQLTSTYDDNHISRRIMMMKVKKSAPNMDSCLSFYTPGALLVKSNKVLIIMQ